MGNELINKIDSDLEQKGECHSGKIGRYVNRFDRTIVFAEPMSRSEFGLIPLDGNENSSFVLFEEGIKIGQDSNDGYVIRRDNPDFDEWFPKALFDFSYKQFKEDEDGERS